MGTSSSKPSSTISSTTAARPTVETYNEKQEAAIDKLARLSLANVSSTSRNVTDSLDIATVKDWSKDFKAKKDNVFHQNIFSKQDVMKAILSRETAIADESVFNLRIPHEVKPVTNQRASGRCWLFATCNVARIQVAKNLNLGDFELSQSYLFFWDCLEKANFYLENMIELVDEPLDSRIVQYLNEMPENDGGQWDMSVNLQEKYGLVPKAVYPESFNSSNSSKLDSFLTSKLREYSLELRKLYKSVHSASNVEAAMRSARARKSQQLQEIFNILSISLGSPPQPNEEFTWDYYDKNGKANTIKTTPLRFLSEQAKGFKPDDQISIINDPRNEYLRAYTVERLGNVYGGRPVRYVNAEALRLREIIVSVLKSGSPLFFGCDVGQYSDSSLGIMDKRLYDFEGAFGTKRNLNKADRLKTGDSMMTHAMVITGAHVVDGEAVRFRVENSWSSDVGDKGYFVASAEWIDEFVYQVVADRNLLPKDLVKVYETDSVISLPAWDPLGALA